MSGNPKQADILVSLAEGAELFHSPRQESYATIPVGDHWETHQLRRISFRRWLVGQFYARTKSTPNAQALQDAIGILDSRAIYEGAEEPVWIRVAECDDAIYLDLGNKSWSAVEIIPSGWRILSDPPVKFRRTPGMRALPDPQAGGSVALLRDFVNVGSDDDFRLSVSWVTAALRPRGPYPVLALDGEQGSAKSTTERVLRECIDPVAAPLRSLPRQERNLAISANNQWVVAFDNVSRMMPWQSDCLCRLATGGGVSERELYTDDDEIIFEATRPIMLNGIEGQAERDDLRDRAVLLTLPPIPKGKHRDEETFWMEFGELRPKILGALCMGIGTALARLPDTILEHAPRMADYARFVTAAERGYGWAPGSFLEAYQRNRETAVEVYLDHDEFGSAVRGLIAAKGEFVGTAGELLQALNQRIGDRKPGPDWPKSPKGASDHLTRSAPALRRMGIEAGRLKKRQVHIHRMVTASTVPTVQTVLDRPTGDGADGADGAIPTRSMDVEGT